MKSKQKSKEEDFDPEKQFQKLYEKAVKLGLTGKDFEQMEALKCLDSGNHPLASFFMVVVTACAIVFGVLYMLFIVYLIQWPVSNDTLLTFWFGIQNLEMEKEPCIVQVPELLGEVFRPPVDCQMCQNLTQVDYVSKITPDQFEKLYAYSGIPVVIEDGTQNWTAPAFFSFQFFKELYKEGSPALENVEKYCQFFPYKTSFQNLGEVFEMSPERAQMEDGAPPWYIGWSNCDFSAANILRSHYKRPYFLPTWSESSKTDWIFMGSPGYGAHLHIDNVQNPSWQAQITGTKKWTLEPPPECYYVCKERLEVVVHPGEIIVLDTNIWYHSTLNVGDSISITIGSEYD